MRADETLGAGGVPVPVTRGGDRCPVCNAAAVATIALDAFTLYRCPGCRCWSSDALARGAGTSFDPADYFENADADRPRWAALWARAGSAARSVLDVGCGTGAFLAFAAGQAPDARRVGIELDPARAARARDATGAEIAVGDVVAALDRIEGRFDLITLWDVFEHLPEPGVALTALSRRLAPGGRLYLQTIHEYSAAPTLGRLAYRWSGGRISGPARRTHEAHHLVFFSREGLGRLAADAGLAVEARWFDRLARARMDGPAWLTAATALALRLENALGNGLFVNLLLSPAPESG